DGRFPPSAPCRTALRSGQRAGLAGERPRREQDPMNPAGILATKGDKVVTIRAQQSIREALGLLAQHNSGALVVVDDARRPIGVLSERDIVRTAARNEAVFGLRVNHLMTRDL